MTVLGVVFRPEFAPERLRSAAQAAEESGLAELWLWEDCFRTSGTATAVAVLGWTERLRVGVGLLPVPLRNVTLSAMEIATVERLFPGRAVIGFGHGVQEWMGQVGARPDSPVTLLREYLTALRRLVAGEEVTTSGRYINLDHVQLAWPPATTPTVLAGAIGPKSLAVCAEAADGIILTGFAGLAGIRRTRDMVGDRPVTAYVRAAIGKDAQARIDAEDTEELSATNDNIPAMIQQLSEAGANTVVLVPTPDEPDIEGLIRYAAGLS